MNCAANEISEKLSEYFSSKSDVNLALIFGSYARGKFRDSSDVDIALDFSAADEDERLEKWLTMRAELELLLGREIDLVDFSKAEGLILSQIIEKNIRVKNNSELYAKYNLKAIYFNEDFLPTLREIQKKKIARFVNE